MPAWAKGVCDCGAVAAPEATPKFEVGKRYRTRTGEIRGPLEWHDDLKYYPFSDHLGRHWTIDGKFDVAAVEPQPFDLLPGAIPDEPTVAAESPINDKSHPRFCAGYDAGLQDGRADWQARAEKAEAALARIAKFFEVVMSSERYGPFVQDDVAHVCIEAGLTVIQGRSIIHEIQVHWKDGE